MVNVQNRPTSQVWVSWSPAINHCLLEPRGGAPRRIAGVSRHRFSRSTISMPDLREHVWVVEKVHLSGPFPRVVPYTAGPHGGGPSGAGNAPPLVGEPEDSLLGFLINGYVKGPVTEVTSQELHGSDDPLVRNLAAIGHTLLAQKIQGKTGMIWEGIRRVGSPLLMELLVDLYTLCREKAGGEGKPLQALIKIMMFCLRIANGAMPPLTGDREMVASLSRVDQLAVEEAHQHIGRVMYLANRDLLQVEKWIDTENMVETLKKIEVETQANLEEISSNVRACFAQHYATGLQDKDRATAVRLSREMAKALLCDNGTINGGIINDVKAHVMDRWSAETPYQRHTSYVLAMLRNFPELREKIAKITRPEEKARNARSLIAVTLDLPKDTEIQDLHARQTVLIALLSHLRQGKVGSCFASFLPIVLLAADLDTCLKDFTDLVQQGQLLRHVDKSPVPFPFRLRMSRERLGKILKLDHSGKAVSEQGVMAPFWEAPGIQAACRILGIADPSDAGRKVFQRLLHAKESHTGASLSLRYFDTTIEDILKGLVDLAVESGEVRPSQRAHLFSIAVFAFESQTSCALQRVWEGVIADMAEATEHGFIKPQVIDCILFSLERKLRVVCRGKKPLMDATIEGVRYVLRQRIRLVFDPTLKGMDENADGHSSQGGFVLCDGSLPASPHHPYSHVASPKDFQGFTSRALNAVEMRLIQKKKFPAAQLQELFNTLTQYVQTDTFVLQAIKKCSPFPVAEPLANYSKMDITPWCFKTGANYKTVLPTYFGVSGVPRISTFFCRNASSLAMKVLEIVRNHQFWIAKSHSPRKIIPASAHGLHVFSIMLDHPSLKPILRATDAPKWLKENVVAPGLRVAKSPVDATTRSDLLAFCFASFSPDVEGRPAFYSDLIDIPHDCSNKEYRDRVLDTVFKHRPELDDEGKALATLSVDTALIQSLPKLQRERIQNTALHFGDTHWHTGMRDIHFAVALNPGASRLELCEINDDNSDLKTLDQVYWLQARDWEVVSFAE